MEKRRLAIIDGHPDADPARFVHALAERYEDGAIAAGHDVRCVDVATLTFPLIMARADWECGEVPVDIRQAQETVLWAEHLLILYPL